MSINRGMDKIDMVHIQWSITQPLKKNKVMPFVETRMDLVIELIQRKTNIISYHFYLLSKIWYKMHFGTQQK